MTGVAVDYNRDQVGSTAAYDGQMNMITGNWSHILSSSKDTRFTMNAAVSQVDDTQKQGTPLVTAYEEKYMTGELGLTYSQFERGEGAYSFSFGGSAKMGLTDDAEGTFAVADTSPANSALAVTERQSKFTTIKPSIAFVKSLGSKVDLQLTYNAQMANERLPQAQQYVLGGASSMSAWLPGVMIGDEGYHAKIALGYSFTMLNANWKVSVFTEKGESSYVNADDDLKQSASDSGIALVGQFGKSLTINLISARAADESFYADNVEEAKIKETNLLGQLVYRF